MRRRQRVHEEDRRQVKMVCRWNAYIVVRVFGMLETVLDSKFISCYISIHMSSIYRRQKPHPMPLGQR